MKIKVSIANFSNLPTENCLNWQDETLFLNFNSLDSLVSFLKSDQESSLFEEEFSQIKRKVNNHLLEIKDQIKKEPITIEGMNKTLPIPAILQDYQIIYNLENYSLKEILAFLNKMPNSNILYLDKYNRIKPRTKEELLETYQKMMEASNFIKSLNLSPAETVFMVFDLTRQRRAIEAKDEKSQDLYEVLHNEEIVCVGYANIFACLCELLNITSEKLCWKSTISEDEPGHESNLVYLNDPKYNIHGLYAFDATWNHIEDNSSFHQNNCNWSFLPLNIEISCKNKKNLELEYNSLYVLLITRLNRLEQLVTLKAPKNIIQKQYSLIKEVLSKIYNLIGKSLDSTYLKDITKIRKLVHLLEVNVLPVEDLRQIITTVRDIEALINPVVYPNDQDSLNSLEKSSYSYMYQQKTLQFIRKLFDSKK